MGGNNLFLCMSGRARVIAFLIAIVVSQNRAFALED